MWFGPRLKFARARVKLEDAAALVYTNWGGDRWGHSVYCSPVDYWSHRHSPETVFALLPLLGSLWKEMLKDRRADEPVYVSRFVLRPHDAVPEGEVWLVPDEFLGSL
jgi:hypothetical protein